MTKSNPTDTLAAAAMSSPASNIMLGTVAGSTAEQGPLQMYSAFGREQATYGQVSQTICNLLDAAGGSSLDLFNSIQALGVVPQAARQCRE